LEIKKVPILGDILLDCGIVDTSDQNDSIAVIIVAVIVGCIIKIFLYYYMTKRSNLSMNTDQKLFMQIHGDTLNSSTPAYRRK